LTENPHPHLADVGFERLAPSPDLRPFVRWYWSMQSNGRLANQREEFMHPDGGVGLVFNWGEALLLPDGIYPQSVTLDTVWAQSQRLLLAGVVNTFGIRFHPGGAYALFGVPMDELTETAVLSQHLTADFLSDLHEQLFEAAAFAEKVAVIERWLLHQLRQLHELSPVVRPALALIANKQGQLSVPSVAEVVALSPRQLERLFKAQVGLSPKKYARIVRVGQAREVLKLNVAQADVAYDAGFYDQAHFIREFKAVVGLTPGVYQQRREERGE
jgi:AraC-like DNA-binding protein